MADPFALGGNHVPITGGSSGLGHFFAETLAAQGAHVTVAAHRAEALAKSVDQIGEQKVWRGEHRKDVEGALEAAKGQFGPIEVVVNAVTDRGRMAHEG